MFLLNHSLSSELLVLQSPTSPLALGKNCRKPVPRFPTFCNSAAATPDCLSAASPSPPTLAPPPAPWAPNLLPSVPSSPASAPHPIDFLCRRLKDFARTGHTVNAIKIERRPLQLEDPAYEQEVLNTLAAFDDILTKNFGTNNSLQTPKKNKLLGCPEVSFAVNLGLDLSKILCQ